jgi:carbamoyl-phosphate synthase large subunit
MEKKVVLVTGVGGNVGQGIIRNIKSLPYKIIVVGTNITDFSSGNYLCDFFYKIPYAYDENYIDAIIDIVKKEKIDLLIPSTDYEVFYLSKNLFKIPCNVAVSGFLAAKIYLDKYETWIHHNKYNIPFAKSYLPSIYSNQFKKTIVKPRKGRGSRGIHINPIDFSVFNDEEYMVQEMFVGEEITTAFYVTKKKKLHGFITMIRTLENGTTNLCKVSSQYDYLILPILEKMIENSPIIGSANLQSIVTSDGSVIPFEVNCRISGTNSIRSNFGFKDVQYTIQEFLFNEEPEISVLSSGIAVRVLLDVIYPNQTEYNLLKDNTFNHFLF